MTHEPTIDALGGLLAPYTQQVEEDLRLWLREPDVPAALAEAMEYCVFSGGKRLRPALVHMIAQAVGEEKPGELSRRGAVAVELMHCASLVHDDLPAMDDDELRRGQPTAHVRFGEAMAILVGDALIIRAFGVLGESEDAASRELVAALARGSGPAGMIGGQTADMDLCHVPEGAEGLRFIHGRKTAALFEAATTIGAICARAQPRQRQAAAEYGRSLGLTFQLIDDLLDVTGSAEQIGKATGKDAQAGKRTYAEEMGLEEARRIGRELTEQTIEAIQPLGPRGQKLTALARLLLERTW